MVIDKLVGAAHFLGHFTESLFDPVDRRQQALRLRQAKQRKRSVGLQLDDALDHGPGTFAAQPAVEHEDAHKARRIGLEVGRKQGKTIGIFSDRQAGAIEQLCDRQLFLFLRQKVQIQRHQ